MYLLVFIGSGVLGGPPLGSVDEHLGPHVGMLLAGAVPAVTTLLVALTLFRHRQASAGHTAWIGLPGR